MDFIITEEWYSKAPYNFLLFRDSLFEFGYMDVKDAIVWLAIPEEDSVAQKMKQMGYVKGQTYFNFLEMVYGNDYLSSEAGNDNIFQKKKTRVT